MNNGARGIVAVGCAIVALLFAVVVAVVLLGFIFLKSAQTDFGGTPSLAPLTTQPAPAPAIPAPVSEPVEIPPLEELKPIIVTPETIESENLEIEIIQPEPESEPAPTDRSL